MSKVRLTLAMLLTLFVAGTTTACDAITGLTDITGTYTLQSVNGEELPWVEDEDEEWRFELTGITITLNDDDTCPITVSWRTVYKPEDTEETGSESITGCTYTTSGSSITLTIVDEVDGEEDTQTLTGTIAGNTMTISDSGDTLVFEK